MVREVIAPNQGAIFYKMH